jgi:hypothetical protein
MDGVKGSIRQRGSDSFELRAAYANIVPAVGAHTTVAALLDQLFVRGRGTWSPSTVRNLATTLNLYAHAVPGGDRRAAEALQRRMSEARTNARLAGSHSILVQVKLGFCPGEPTP